MHPHRDFNYSQEIRIRQTLMTALGKKDAIHQWDMLHAQLLGKLHGFSWAAWLTGSFSCDHISTCMQMSRND